MVTNPEDCAGEPLSCSATAARSHTHNLAQLMEHIQYAFSSLETPRSLTDFCGRC